MEICRVFLLKQISWYVRFNILFFAKIRHFAEFENFAFKKLVGIKTFFDRIQFLKIDPTKYSNYTCKQFKLKLLNIAKFDPKLCRHEHCTLCHLANI